MLCLSVKTVFEPCLTFMKFASLLFSGADESLKDETRLLLLGDGSLVTLHTHCVHPYICIYMVFGIHHWRILWSSYRKLAWVGFETTTTEFRSDVLTDWAIRPWVQLALRANVVQLHQYHRLLSVTFHFGYCLCQ